MKRQFLLLLVAVIITACGNGANDKYTTLTGFAEGTTYKIVYQDPQGRDLTSEIVQFFEDFDNSLSIYNPSSIVSRTNYNDTTVVLDDWFVECFELSQKISKQSDGLFDITLRPLISAYGFGGEDGPRVLTQKQVDSMRRFVGYQKVSIKDSTLFKQDSRIELDFNAVAKGFSVDLLGELIASKGIENYLVEVGGEIVTKGKNSKGADWKVAIDTPYEGNFTPGASQEAVIEVSGVGLATSGNYRKFAVNEDGEKVVHTIDPRTGKPAIHNLLSATIIAPTCGTADAFATACMVAGLEGAKKIVTDNPELEALLIYSEGDELVIFSTEGMKKRIVTSK